MCPTYLNASMARYLRAKLTITMSWFLASKHTISWDRCRACPFLMPSTLNSGSQFPYALALLIGRFFIFSKSLYYMLHEKRLGIGRMLDWIVHQQCERKTLRWQRLRMAILRTKASRTRWDVLMLLLQMPRRHMTATPMSQLHSMAPNPCLLLWRPHEAYVFKLSICGSNVFPYIEGRTISRDSLATVAWVIRECSGSHFWYGWKCGYHRSWSPTKYLVTSVPGSRDAPCRETEVAFTSHQWQSSVCLCWTWTCQEIQRAQKSREIKRTRLQKPSSRHTWCSAQKHILPHRRITILSTIESLTCFDVIERLHCMGPDVLLETFVPQSWIQHSMFLLCDKVATRPNSVATTSNGTVCPFR